MHWKTHRNGYLTQPGILQVTSTQLSSLKPTAKPELCLTLRASPEGIALDGIISESAHHKRDQVWGRNLCKTSQATFLKILANDSLHGAVSWPGGEERTTCPEWVLVSQLGAGGFSQQFQQIMGATPCAESSAAPKHCIFALPSLGTCNTQ